MKAIEPACRRALPSHGRQRYWHTLRATRLWARQSRPTGTIAVAQTGISIAGRVKNRTFHCSPLQQTPHSTIYALSSAPGRAAIAVIRISGPACVAIYNALCPGGKPLKPRTAAVRTLHQPGVPVTRDTVLDPNALVLQFQAPGTATGEDILEFHVHGGPAIVKAVLAAISACGTECAGQVRYAEAGEFTRRAFMNDRLDLTQVEALGDTLSADTEQQRRLSVRGSAGVLARQYEQWRQQLLYARGELEALIDFSEDQHFDESPAELCASVGQQVQTLRQALHIHSQNAVRGEMLRHGISISLLGQPNAGKSSLLNRIVGREAAIVSSEAGTTRDIVEIGVDLGGYFCRFGDTAGLRKAQRDAIKSGHTQELINKIELEGMRRAKARAIESDLVVVVLSFERNGECESVLHFDTEVKDLTKRLLAEDPRKVIIVINKADLVADDEAARKRGMYEVLQAFPALAPNSVHLISCSTTNSNPVPSHALDTQSSHDPGGIQGFLQGLIRRFGTMTAALGPEADDSSLQDADPSVWQESLGASERHRTLLDACVSHLDAFLQDISPSRMSHHHDHAIANNGGGVVVVDDDIDIVVAAEHLRYAADCLAKITGRGDAGDVEEVLGVVFEKFCVGK